MRAVAPLAAILLVLSACAEQMDSPVAPTLRPAFELADPDQRVEAKEVNAHTYGTFVLVFDGSPTVILSGPANFPGNPPGGPGTCVDGLWYNSRGKATAGTLTHPHPHCITPEGQDVTVVLEPISSRVRDPWSVCTIGSVCDFIDFSNRRIDSLDVEFSTGIRGAVGTNGDGVLQAYAIDASTLGTTNRRVGILSIDLNQYDEPSVNLFGTCFLDEEAKFACLPRGILADYVPLEVGGVGSPVTAKGFLWWASATAPYNY